MGDIHGRKRSALVSNKSTETDQSADQNDQEVGEGRREGDPAELGFASGDLGRIQGILLGEHARRIDTRFSEQEAQVNQQIQGLVADLENTNQALRGEIEVLKAELAEERASRLEAMRLATEERAASSHEFDKFKTEVRKDKKANAASLAELRADSVANLDDLGSRVDAEMSEITDRLDREGTHRRALSEVLREAAERVADEETHSGSE